MSKIFDGDLNDADVNFATDNEYAKNYNNWRKKEELNKLKTKYGDDVDLDDESSSSSDDDEDGVELTEEVEKEFYKTLSYLKNKDPRIYNENTKFFENIKTESPKKPKKEKPMFLKDYERKMLLEGNGESDEEHVEESRAQSPTYVQEQQQLRDSLKKALQDNDDEDNDDELGGVLKARTKSKEEKEKEEADYKEWLAGQRDELEDKQAESELKPLKDYWNNPKLDNSEKFLRDYILNKRFLSKEDEDYIPTYEEIVHDSDKDLSEDEEAIEKQEEFEHKYNFRFEEPDQDFIKRYPRTIEQSLRRTDDRRKVKRAETKERKLKEKEEKMQDLKKLQEMKKKEIEEKIEKLKEITGNTDVGFDADDLDADFDPEAHDQRMQKLFNDEFYQGEEDEQKPEFPDLDQYLEIENWEKWKGDDQSDHQPHCEDEDFNMDADFDPSKPSIASEMIENSKGRKKRRRKSLFAQAISQPKPVFDPNDKTFEEYIDEYYKFDCEDLIGDIPCRFKYRKVVPNSFGLSIEEILTANDRELNKWCSLKKAIQHRPDHVEKYDQIAFEKRGQNLELKRKILPSLFQVEKKEDSKPDTSGNSGGNSFDSKEQSEKQNEQTSENVAGSSKIKKKRKRKQKQTSCNDEKPVDLNEKTENLAVNDKNKNGKRKNPAGKQQQSEPAKKKHKNAQPASNISDARLSAYGINPKKFKNKLKYGKKSNK